MRRVHFRLNFIYTFDDLKDGWQEPPKEYELTIKIMEALEAGGLVVDRFTSYADDVYLEIEDYKEKDE